MIVLVWLAVAQAQDPPPPSEEIVVYGELAIQKARDAIVDDMESLGYKAIRKDDRIVFRPPKSWMGKAVLHEDGRITFTRPLLALQGAQYQGSLSRDLEPNPNVARDGQTGSGGVGVTVVPEKSKLETVRTRVQQSVQDELDHYVAVVAETAFQDMLLELPDRLDALWTDGAPLQTGKPVLPTPEARRREVLELWATRTDTPEGRKTCKAIEAWLDAVVQESEHPITDAERTEFEARRDDGRTLP